MIEMLKLYELSFPQTFGGPVLCVSPPSPSIHSTGALECQEYVQNHHDQPTKQKAVRVSLPDSLLVFTETE